MPPLKNNKAECQLCEKPRVTSDFTNRQLDSAKDRVNERYAKFEADISGFLADEHRATGGGRLAL